MEGQWRLIEPLLPPERGRPGRPSRSNRELVNAILWVSDRLALAGPPGVVRIVAVRLDALRPLGPRQRVAAGAGA